MALSPVVGTHEGRALLHCRRLRQRPFGLMSWVCALIGWMVDSEPTSRRSILILRICKLPLRLLTASSSRLTPVAWKYRVLKRKLLRCPPITGRSLPRWVGRVPNIKAYRVDVLPPTNLWRLMTRTVVSLSPSEAPIKPTLWGPQLTSLLGL